MRIAMRHSVLLLLGTLALPACVAESQQARPVEPGPGPGPDRSQETLREIDRQRRWTADALAARPPADELEAVRDGDADAISDTRRRFRRLLTAVERATWIRETVPEVLRASASPDRLVAAFDGAGRDRNEALAAADASARALAGSRSRNAISLEELKRALQVAHLARQSEQRLAANLGRAAPAGPVQVSGDLKRLLSRRGPPLSIGQRSDGLTAFRYREQRPCGVDRCTVTVDYLFDSQGHLMRSEVVKP